MKYLAGPISVSAKGVGYLKREGEEESLQIEPAFLNTALHGDTVKVLPHPQVAGEPPTGEVVEILNRKRSEFVGVLERENGFYFLVPDDKRLYKDLLVSPEHLHSAAD